MNKYTEKELQTASEFLGRVAGHIKNRYHQKYSNAEHQAYQIVAYAEQVVSAELGLARYLCGLDHSAGVTAAAVAAAKETGIGVPACACLGTLDMPGAFHSLSSFHYGTRRCLPNAFPVERQVTPYGLR